MDLECSKFNNLFFSSGSGIRVYNEKKLQQNFPDLIYDVFSLLTTKDEYEFVLTEPQKKLFEFSDYFKVKYSTKFRLTKYLFIGFGDC